MHSLDQSTVPSWQNVANWWFPSSIDTNCPFCGKLVNFAPTGHQYDAPRKTMASNARCPGCGETVYIWAIDPGPANDSSKQTCSCLAIFPPPDAHREPIKGSNAIPDRIRRAYLETVGVFNAGVWSATATCTRRTLEGLVKEMLSTESSETLAARIKSLSKSEDLGKPLVTLSDLIREGGNIGAHFDLDREPDREMARAMLDLLDYLLEYVYGLPAMIETLKNRINESEEQSAEGSTSDG